MLDLLPTPEHHDGPQYYRNPNKDSAASVVPARPPKIAEDFVPSSGVHKRKGKNKSWDPADEVAVEELPQPACPGT